VSARNLIAERVGAARRGSNPYVIEKLPGGWLVIGDVQPLPGYCLLLADPVVGSINDLSVEDRQQFSQDMCRVGDALLKVTDAVRINYEIWGNSEPALHAHIMPRYMWEAQEAARKPACMRYSWSEARRFDPERDRAFIDAVRVALRG